MNATITIWKWIFGVLLILTAFYVLGCGYSKPDTQTSSIAPPEAQPQRAEFRHGLPPAGWTAGVAWVVALHDTRKTGASSLDIDWVRFYCIVNGQETFIAGEQQGNGTGVAWGGLYTRSPWFGNNNAHTAMDVNFTGDAASLPLSTIPDKVWHFGGARPVIPVNATRCYAAARVKPNGNTVVQLGVDFWKDQTVDFCGLDLCNTEGSASDWFGMTSNWIIIYSGKP